MPRTGRPLCLSLLSLSRSDTKLAPHLTLINAVYAAAVLHRCAGVYTEFPCLGNQLLSVHYSRQTHHYASLKRTGITGILIDRCDHCYPLHFNLHLGGVSHILRQG